MGQPQEGSGEMSDIIDYGRVNLTDEANALMKLMDALDDDDDVQNVFANFEMSDEDMAKLAE